MSKKIEDKYKKLDDIEHVILKPSMYIGSTKSHSTTKWLLNIDKFEKREVTYNPGFLKLIDEIVINSIDESKRPESKLNIVNINIIDNKITVWDNGGIPVVKHKEYNEYIPEIIFSNMRAGSNFTESDDRTWSGTNGVGSSIVNIFSKEFIVSTSDGKNQFTQIFSNNMRNKTKAKITKSTKKFTEISFTPDLERFGLSKIDYDHFLMIEKRVYDLAGCNPNIKFIFNGTSIKISSFTDYIKLYTDEYFFEANKEKTWSIGIGVSDNGFQQISFANSTETYDGGTHVDYIMNQIVVQLREFFLKKHKVDIKPNELKSHMTLFLDTTIINPSFSSQTKEKLITEVKEFGSTYEVSSKLIQSILKSEIVNSILDWIDQKKNAEANKLQRDLNKKLSKIKVDKLIDAKGKDRWKCSLALFEGDCLEENTLVRVLREGDLLDIKIKNINIGDLVITHNNRFQEVSALTKNIQYKNIIKTNIGDIKCSNKHRFFVYDVDKNEFLFEHVYNLDKNKHKLVKNQLCFMDALLEIDEISNNILKMKSGELFEVSSDHRLCVYNKVLDKFEMEYFENIVDISKYLIVNTFTI